MAQRVLLRLIHSLCIGRVGASNLVLCGATGSETAASAPLLSPSPFPLSSSPPPFSFARPFSPPKSDNKSPNLCNYSVTGRIHNDSGVATVDVEALSHVTLEADSETWGDGTVLTPPEMRIWRTPRHGPMDGPLLKLLQGCRSIQGDLHGNIATCWEITACGKEGGEERFDLIPCLGHRRLQVVFSHETCNPLKVTSGDCGVSTGMSGAWKGC